LRDYSYRTEESYVDWARRFILLIKKSAIPPKWAFPKFALILLYTDPKSTPAKSLPQALPKHAACFSIRAAWIDNPCGRLE